MCWEIQCSGSIKGYIIPNQNYNNRYLCILNKNFKILLIYDGTIDEDTESNWRNTRDIPVDQKYKGRLK